jgi:hypothetical protein
LSAEHPAVSVAVQCLVVHRRFTAFLFPAGSTHNAHKDTATEELLTQLRVTPTSTCSITLSRRTREKEAATAATAAYANGGELAKAQTEYQLRLSESIGMSTERSAAEEKVGRIEKELKEAQDGLKQIT